MSIEAFVRAVAQTVAEPRDEMPEDFSGYPELFLAAWAKTFLEDMAVEGQSTDDELDIERVLFKISSHLSYVIPSGPIGDQLLNFRLLVHQSALAESLKNAAQSRYNFSKRAASIEVKVLETLVPRCAAIYHLSGMKKGEAAKKIAKAMSQGGYPISGDTVSRDWVRYVDPELSRWAQVDPSLETLPKHTTYGPEAVLFKWVTQIPIERHVARDELVETAVALIPDLLDRFIPAELTRCTMAALPALTSAET